MLFDLRGRGRRRAVQGIYLGLAVLIGGGLVFFGIGGSGTGLFNSDNNNGPGGGQSVAGQIKSAEKRTKANPRDVAAWGDLVRAHYNDAQAETGQTQGGGLAYTSEGLNRLRKSADSWKRYIALNPPKPDIVVANVAFQALRDLNRPSDAAQALEVTAEARPSAGAYTRLACVAYVAGQKRKAALAGAEAVRRAPKAARKQFTSQIAQYEKAGRTQPLANCG